MRGLFVLVGILAGAALSPAASRVMGAVSQLPQKCDPVDPPCNKEEDCTRLTDPRFRECSCYCISALATIRGQMLAVNSDFESAVDQAVAGRFAIAPTNVVADEAVRRLWGLPLPPRPSGGPVTSSELYSGFNELQWVEIEDAGDVSSRVGSLAVWRSMMGVVVQDDADGIAVLYPSTKRGGALSLETTEWLGDGSEPIFLVPEEAVSTMVREQ